MSSKKSRVVPVRLDVSVAQYLDENLVHVFGGRREAVEAALAFVRVAGPDRVRRALAGPTDVPKGAH